MIDWTDLLAQLVKGEFIAGESLVLLHVEPVEGSAVPLAPQIIAPSQLDSSVDGRKLPNGHLLRRGVELDARGRAVAYHVLRDDPAAGLPGATLPPIRILAGDLLHLYEVQSPGQVRGISRLAACLLRLHDLDQLEDAGLMLQKMAAHLSAFISPEDTFGTVNIKLSPTFDKPDEMLTPGSVSLLRTGDKIEFSDPPESRDLPALAKHHLRAIAAAAGITYEMLTGDLAEASYSAARASRLEHQRLARASQQRLVSRVVRPIWRRFIALASLAGQIPESAFLADPAAFFRMGAALPAWGSIDPHREIEAELKAIAGGLKSRSQAIREASGDAEETDAERQQERQREVALGLAPAAAPVAEGAGRPAADRPMEEPA